MIKFYKFISVLLHPLVLPTVGVLLFLFLTPDTIPLNNQYVLISLVFLATYFIPLVALLILKAMGLVQSFQVHSIKERKIPVIIMLLIFFILGRLFYSIAAFRELGLLFYAIHIALFIVYFLFFLKIKTSLHVLSMSSMIAFVLIFSSQYAIAILPMVAILFLLTGLLASARLHLNAHKKMEIYLGFFLGFACPFLTFYFL